MNVSTDERLRAERARMADPGRLEEGLDTGPVYGIVTETIRPEDTSGALLDRLAHAGSGLLVATLDAIESGERRLAEQDAPLASAGD